MKDIGIDFTNKEEFLSTMHQEGFFAYESGITVTDINSEHSFGQLDITDKNLNLTRIVHGGALVTLGDTVAGAYVFHNIGRAVTTSQNFYFLRPGLGKTIYCKGTPKKLGSRLCVMDVTLTGEDGKEVASGTFTFYVLPKLGSKE
ncbi:MAG: PaaI family thioesterase [Eubacteriales bacterium]